MYQEMPSSADTTETFTTTNSYVIVDSSENISRWLTLVCQNFDSDGDSIAYMFVTTSATSGTLKDTLISGNIAPGTQFDIDLQRLMARWYLYAKSTTDDSTAIGKVNSTCLLY